jgi:hypothetical protein
MENLIYHPYFIKTKKRGKKKGKREMNGYLDQRLLKKRFIV